MLKKFVTLNSNASPSKNPYEVRTYLGDSARPDWKPELCDTDRKCREPNSTISKVLTIEDELRRLHEKAKESRFNRPFRKKCERFDDFTVCVVPQRSAKELKVHARMREKFIQAHVDLNARVHDGRDKMSETPGLVQLDSPMNQDDEEEEEKTYDPEGDEEDEVTKVKPKLASPSCSMDLIYKPPSKLLELRRPKSGMFINETEPPLCDDTDVPYSTFNPRLLQDGFDAQELGKIDIIEGRNKDDLWTWNLGMQKRASDLDQQYKKDMLPEMECDTMELRMFKIPKDLQKTFTAEMVFGTTAILPDTKVSVRPHKKPGYYNRPKEVAALFVAYVESFRLNPDFWTAETMDAILVSGEKLVNKSKNLNYKSTEYDYDILTTIADKQAAIGLKVHYTGPLKEEPNIFKALALYFSKFNAAVLCSKNLYLLIWKRCQRSFYIFDPNGRNETCQRDFPKGKCSLMATQYVEHLVHLIVNYSEADLDSDFNLYEIFLINYGKLTVPVPTKPFPKQTHRLWATVNSTYAIIPAANNGLQQPITGNENNPSMIISLLSLLYSDIERAITWRMEAIDDLVKFGQNYVKAYAKKHKMKKNQKINIVDLPEVVMLGAYRASLKKAPFLYTGHVADCRNYKESQLFTAMKELFNSKWESALIQIDNLVLSLWRDTEYYYVFDPFRRGKAGQVLDPEDFLTKGVACLQMHTNFDSFCRILFQKALKMRRGGKFFLHGVKVGCIRPLLAAKNLRNKYTRLRLTYPTLEDPVEPPPKAPPKKKKKGKKLERTFSIKSIPSDDYIPEYENEDVVNDVLEEVICEILMNLPEGKLKRSPLYKQADKVLFKTDKSYLERLQYELAHGTDYDNIHERFRTTPEPPPQLMTMEEELHIPSNFELLPDGTWVIFGTQQLPQMDENENKLVGLLSNIVAAAVSAKYNISTWNDKLIDYALESAKGFGDEFMNYEKTLDLVLSKHIPKICIGSNYYMLSVKKVMRSAVTRPLRQVLLESLISYNRVLVVCQHFSCLIIKRYNFLYVFTGFPCNAIGYRKFGIGPGCLLRIVELDSLIRRIEFGCNPQGCAVSNYVIVALKVTDVTDEPPERYRKLSESDVDKIYAAELSAQAKDRQHKMDKIRFLDEELRKENERIQGFLTEKERRIEARRRAEYEKRHPKRAARERREAEEAKAAKKKYKGKHIKYAGEDEEEIDIEDVELGEEEEGDGEEESAEEFELKHKPGRKLRRMLEDEYKPRPILYGYRLREKDCLYKIQGSIKLEGRAEYSLQEIKPCYFASVLAILYAVLRPLNQWNWQRIDKVVESSVAIATKVSNMTTAFERVIKNVTVDEYDFDVWAKTFDPVGVWGSTVDRRISKATQTRHYLMLQTANCTFAIYRDDFYHLFDAYASMETLQEGVEEETQDEEEGTDGKKNKCPKGIKRYGERNTASWVLFVDLESMLAYIDKRTSNPDWKEVDEYKLHVVDVISYKKASPKIRILQLLTDLSVPMECEVAQHGVAEKEICAHAETLNWLDVENCLPVWSRMNRRNTAGRYRNLPVTKMKKYDIEIDSRLWSLWGTLHPQAPCFESNSRGKQYLACAVMACCAASVFRLTDWSSQLLDSIVISGDKYHRESLANIQRRNYEFSLEDLNIECTLENIKFVTHIEHRVYGKLYCQPSKTRLNLAEALMYFFTHFQYGVLQCHRRSLAIGFTKGNDGGYFMYDCQSREHPLFPKGQGAGYLLRTRHLQVLLYCIVITMNIPYYNMQFTIHQVAMLREGASVDDEGSEEEEEGG